MNNGTIHRGELLKKAIQASDLNNISLVCKMARISRSSYYNHVEDPDLSFSILEKYGKVIRHDFSEDLPEMRRYSTFAEPEGKWEKGQSYRELENERNDYRDKYLALLEKYNLLIEERLNEDQ